MARRWTHDAELNFTEFCEAVLRVALSRAAERAAREPAPTVAEEDATADAPEPTVVSAAAPADPARAAVTALDELMHATCSSWGADAATERAAGQIERVRCACRRTVATRAALSGD